MSEPTTQETSQDTNTSHSLTWVSILFMKFRIESHWPYFCFHRHVFPTVSPESVLGTSLWGDCLDSAKKLGSLMISYIYVSIIRVYIINPLVTCYILSNTTMQRGKWSKI